MGNRRNFLRGAEASLKKAPHIEKKITNRHPHGEYPPPPLLIKRKRNDKDNDNDNDNDNENNLF